MKFDDQQVGDLGGCGAQTELGSSGCGWMRKGTSVISCSLVLGFMLFIIPPTLVFVVFC